MGLFSKDIATLNDLFVHRLQDVYRTRMSGSDEHFPGRRGGPGIAWS